MNRKDRSSIISVRVPDGLLNLIENDVEKSGEFCSRADWILAAIRYYLDQREKQIKLRSSESDFVSTSSECIQNNVKNTLQTTNKRQIKNGKSLYILDNSKATTVLVECGFISNEEECKKLLEKEDQNELSFSIVCGIIEYINSISS